MDRKRTVSLAPYAVEAIIVVIDECQTIGEVFIASLEEPARWLFSIQKEGWHCHLLSFVPVNELGSLL